MAPGDLQLQFDLVSAAVISGKAIHRLLVACEEDDVKPLAISSLEVFGSSLLVDDDRIARGRSALNPTGNNILTFVKVVIGLSDRGLIKQVQANIHLTASFLFVVACSPNLTVEEVAQLTHRIMALKGILINYPTSSQPLTRFMTAVIGYGDTMEGISPFELSTKLGNVIRERSGGRDVFPGLHDMSPMDKLAKIIHQVFEELQNTDNRRITMEGWRTGIWLATLFLWLRPKETDLSLNGNRIFPSTGNFEVRLHINLVLRHNISDISQWSVHSWRPEEDLGNMVEIMDDRLQADQPHHHYPLRAAKDQMSYSGISDNVLEETGYLAAALVDAVCVGGHLYNKTGSLSLPLQDICSDFFQNSYHTIIKHFGWEYIINDRQIGIANALTAWFKKLRNEDRLTHESGLDDVEFMKKQIYECNRDYRDNHEDSLLLLNESGLSDAIERAIHLAVEALLFSFCVKMPARAIYRPHTTSTLHSHVKILRKLLFGTVIGSSGQPRRIQGFSFWEFRVQAIQSMLPGVTDIDPSDIAVASNGYVVFSAAIQDMNKGMTDRRETAAICVVPGALRLEGEQGRFDKVVEPRQTAVLAGRIICKEYHTVGVFTPDSKFCGVDDSTALDRLGTKIEHLTSVHDDPFGRRVVYLTTFLHPVPESGVSSLLLRSKVDPPVATSWGKSISAITFATHVREHNISPAQEKSLAERWKYKGYLGSDFRWCLVGHEPGPKIRYISATSYNESLRFFEAGNLADGRKLFIRQKHVPLMQCIKEAFEFCGKDPDWAIIS